MHSVFSASEAKSAEFRSTGSNDEVRTCTSNRINSAVSQSFDCLCRNLLHANSPQPDCSFSTAHWGPVVPIRLSDLRSPKASVELNKRWYDIMDEVRTNQYAPILVHEEQAEFRFRRFNLNRELQAIHYLLVKARFLSLTGG